MATFSLLEKRHRLAIRDLSKLKVEADSSSDSSNDEDDDESAQVISGILQRQRS